MFLLSALRREERGERREERGERREERGERRANSPIPNLLINNSN
jgi:hypothetical protein